MKIVLSLHDHIDKCLVGPIVQNSIEKATLDENEHLANGPNPPIHGPRTREQYLDYWDISKAYDLQMKMEIELDAKMVTLNEQQDAHGVRVSSSPFPDNPIQLQEDNDRKEAIGAFRQLYQSLDRTSDLAKKVHPDDSEPSLQTQSAKDQNGQSVFAMSKPTQLRKHQHPQSPLKID